MKTIRYAFARTLPIMAGYLVLGLGFGVLLQSKGYGVGWSLAMSTLIYAGSMQYVTIDLLAGGASLISAAGGFQSHPGLCHDPDGQRPAPVLRHLDAAAI